MELYAGPFVTIHHDADAGLVALEWTAMSAQMAPADFKQALERFVEHIEERGARRLLVDVRAFHFEVTPDLTIWRDERISRRYNDAGVDRLAYVVREGFPVPRYDGKPLSKQELFRTRFFTSMAEARRWLLRS